MIITIHTITNITINELKDLPKLKYFMDNNGLKINKAQIARNLGVDPRTVGKYLDGYEKPKEHKKGSTMDEYYTIIKELLSSETQVFYYRRVLYQYLLDNYDFDIPESTFRHYLTKHPEIDSYFNKSKQSNVSGLPVIRFETGKGIQAQLDWKESKHLTSKNGEIFEINIFLIILGYSRLKYIELTTDRKQETVFGCLVNAFKSFGGVPKEILFDNMKTVVDHAKSEYNNPVINLLLFINNIFCSVGSSYNINNIWMMK